MNTPLRFAPLIRVSTEKQEKKGESLRTQREQIQQYVKSLNGSIPDALWNDYSGQEHATPDQERNKLKKLLSDSSKDIFDAVIVCDASRWSRDNAENKRGLKILRDNNIRFFVAGMEYDLHSPEQSLFLGLAAEINEFHAKHQNLKSIQNRIQRAKRGLPTTGKLPYGRTFDPKTETWGLDEEKAKNIRWAAEQYLSGNSFVNISKALGENPSNIWKVLTQRSSDTWTIDFNPKGMNINESVTISIPRLLSEETIQAIHEKAKANKTYTHGEIKHNYLLSRMIFCDECKRAMFGQTNHNNKRYYRHGHNKTTCNKSLWIPADAIEHAVLLHLFSMFGDVSAMERAITRAIPDHSHIEKMRDQLVDLETKLKSVNSEKQNIIRSVAKGLFTDDEAAIHMQGIREREALLEREINLITPQIENIPTRQHIERRAKMVEKIIKSAYSGTSRLLEMSYDEKKELFQRAFAGHDAQGNRLGLYVKKTNDTARPWQFTIRGILSEVVGQLPLSDFDISEILNLDETESSAKYAYTTPCILQPVFS